MIKSEKWKSLLNQLESLGILETDLREQFVRASGSGGQKVNKTSSAVLLQHIPSGIQVKCQHSRSQADNRYFARKLIAEKIGAKILGKKSAEQKRREKIRRQKRKRSKRAKNKMLKAKKHRSHTIQNRKVDRGGY